AWREILAGLSAAGARCGGRIDGAGVDTWGVDFALLDRGGGLLSLPHHYRDDLCEGMLAAALAAVPRDELFAATGVQFLPFNSLFQLLGLRARRPSLLSAADRLLFLPDLFTYWLGGERAADRTIASTSQCYDPMAGGWARKLLERLALPVALLPPLREPGTVAGVLRPEAAASSGLCAAPIISPGGHDTALAVAAVPARDPRFAYISSGTWSLVGTELTHPILGPSALQAGFTNEAGVAGTTRFLKNVCGLWPIQESRRAWEAAGSRYSHADLAALAEAAPSWQAVIDVDAAAFARPGDMPSRIREYCRATGQPVPSTPGEIVRTVLDSLALKYRQVLRALDHLIGRHVDTVHIVGGGSRNRLLCQLAADATGRLVLAGPVEATAMGNALMQAVALGRLGSLADLREVVAASAEVARYEPRADAAMEEAYGRLEKLVVAGGEEQG
ncbi:MAG: rhamnulokinase, partial [Acidobacteria bacterium]